MSLEILYKGLSSVLLSKTFSPFNPCWTNQVRCFAARKGTRAKAEKKKKAAKVEIKKLDFIPHNLREKWSKGPVQSRRIRDDCKPLPKDDVWAGRFFPWRIYSFEEAVSCHRETHHPEMYNQPNAYLKAFIELDMSTAKKNKFLDSFSRISAVTHPFDHGENRSILVFCKGLELREEVEKAGATLVGDSDFVKKIEKGDVVLPDFDHVLAHPAIIPDLVCLRGLLKKKFPNPKNGTLGLEIGSMVTKFKTGIQYSAFRDDRELDYGWIDAVIGTLNMDVEHLESNFKNLINDIFTMAPKKEGAFVTRVLLTSAPSDERFKLELAPYLPESFKKDAYESDSDDEAFASSAKL